MIITQIVEIPADRRITLELPHEIPTGQARFEYKVIPFVKKGENPANAVPENGRKTLGMTMKELDKLLKNAHTPHSDALSGLLSGIEDITTRQIREERLAEKYPEYFTGIL